jgi:DegV family protein with EDD domain
LEEEVAAGRDILCVMCSSECSGSYNTVVVVANELMEEHPECKIYVVDTYLECAAAGLLVYLAQEMKKQGYTIEKVRDTLEERKGNADIYFLVDHLDYLVRGGRLSTVSGAVGSVLNIKPILHFEEGKIVSLTKCRGKHNGKRMILDLLKKMNLDKTLVIVAHTDNLTEAKEYAAMLENELDLKVRFINEVNPTIGTHTGPDGLAVAFCTLPESK